MAVRVDVHAIEPGVDIETLDPPALLAATVGWVSASDADEQALFDLLGALADHSGFDARVHGVGQIPSASGIAGYARSLASTAQGTVRNWAATLAAALESVESSGRGLGWQTRYDRGGTTDDGSDEFATGWALGGPTH